MTIARESTTRLAGLLRREHLAMAEFLVALAEFDGQRLWLELGYSGLFNFLHRELGLSKAAAFYRKTAAEVVQTFPEIIEPLRDGRLCLTAIVELAKVITLENRNEVLPRFFHCSNREAKVIVAELSPALSPPRRDVVTNVQPGHHPDRREPVTQRRCDPVPLFAASATSAASATGLASCDSSTGSPREPHDRCQTMLAPAGADEAEPLTADLRRLHVTVSARFLQKLERAKAALSHTHAGATMGAILEAGLDLVLERDARKKGLVKKPRRTPRPSVSEHVPAHVRREVWRRDGGRCQWPLESGEICGSTVRVELDHIVPRALGGPSSVEGTRLLCRFHNDLAARQAFGDRWMDRFTGSRQAPPSQ